MKVFEIFENKIIKKLSLSIVVVLFGFSLGFLTPGRALAYESLAVDCFSSDDTLDGAGYWRCTGPNKCKYIDNRTPDSYSTEDCSNTVE